jgi:hypothetical protein
MMTTTMPPKIYLAAVRLVSLLAAISYFAAADQVIFERPEHKVQAVFVNEDSRLSIDLYWVNHDVELDDPDRLVSV